MSLPDFSISRYSLSFYVYGNCFLYFTLRYVCISRDQNKIPLYNKIIIIHILLCDYLNEVSKIATVFIFYIS